MKHMCIILIVAIVLFSCVSAPAVAQLTNTTWTAGDSTRDWSTSNNWNNGVPTSSHHAIIPATTLSGRMPRLNGGESRTAGKLTLEVDGSDRGKIEVWGNSTLILGDGSAQTSMIDGDLYVGEDASHPGKLKIDGAHTLQGDGGVIHLVNFDSTIEEKDSAGDSLILQSSDGSCTGESNDRSCSVLVHGTGQILVELDNRAWVVSDANGLTLGGEGKTGTGAGFWVAENDATLHVETEVHGGCAWQVIDVGDTNTTIWIKSSGCVQATGPVVLKEGCLKCQGPFCTTGKLTWTSVTSGGGSSSPAIRVYPEISATFGLGGASACASCP